MQIYEIQNKGKGVIRELIPDDLLLIEDDRVPTLDEVMYTNGGRINFGHIVYIDQYVSLDTINGGLTGPLVLFTNPINASFPLNPLYRIGLGSPGSPQDTGLAFYADRVLFTDQQFDKGLEYGGDYESNFTARSLVTKQFVESSYTKQKVVTLGAWLLSRQYAVNMFLSPSERVISVTPFLRCVTASQGYNIGDIINVPTPEVNDSGGLSAQGIGIQFQRNSTIVNIMIDERLAIKGAYDSTPGAAPSSGLLQSPSSWQIDLVVLYK